MAAIASLFSSRINAKLDADPGSDYVAALNTL